MTKSILLKPLTKNNPIFIGQKFGRLTVIGEPEIRESKTNNSRRRYYPCRCECGNETTVSISELNNGHTKSCGCLQKDHAYKLKFKHGFSRHPLNNVYDAMKARCYQESSIEFAHYGGRGIKICDKWLNDRKSFYEWALANGWEEGLWFDRIRVNEGYHPGNCRFVTAGLSARNTRAIQSTNTSGYRGVAWHKKDKAWVANIQCDNEKYYLGQFDSAIEAAQAYDHKAKELNAGHPLNFP